MVVKSGVRIPISNVDLTELERGYVNECMESGIISGTGGFVRRFEEALKAWLGRQHAIAVSNGTVALEVTLNAMGIGAGDEVLVPALTFVAPAAAVRRVGATPVIVDVDERDWCISVVEASKHITPRTKAIIAVDILGHPANFKALRSLELPIIEDAAQGHGARYSGALCGSLGDVSTFSFFANKALTCGEGGAVLTDDAELAERIRLIANHGMKSSQRYYHEVVGTNARLSNLQAAIGLGQTERASELTHGRQAVARRYRRFIEPEWGFTFRPVAPWAEESAYLFTLTHEHRDPIVSNLNDLGVDTRNVWHPISQLPIYAPFTPDPCPVAEWVATRAFSLPTSSVMTRDEVDDVIRCLGEAVMELDR